MKIKFNLKDTLVRYRRVLIVARKPDRQELTRTLRICGTGFLVIGFLGFVFYIISAIGGA